MPRPFISLFILSIASLLILKASGMRCQETTIRHYVDCKDECFSFADPSVLLKINKCKDKERFGCLLNQCGGAGFECAHDPDHKFPLCGNDKTIFDEVSIDTASNAQKPLKFLVDVNAPPLKVQYFFLVDTTHTMASEIHMVKKKINELIDMYKTMPEIDATFALGEYRDPQYGGAPTNRINGQCGIRHLSGFTDDIHAFQSKVHGLTTASSGINGPKGLLPSILQAASEPKWSTSARKILVVFGDSPGYESSKHDIFWLAPSQVPWNIDRHHVAKFLKDRDIVYIGVNAKPSGLDAPTYPFHGGTPLAPATQTSSNPGQSSYLAQQTGGVVTSPSKTLMQAVIDAKESYEHEYTMDTSACSNKLVINEGKQFRVRLKPSTSSTVDMTMSLKGAFCDPFHCEIKYFEDGVQLVPMSLNFLKIVGCPPLS